LHRNTRTDMGILGTLIFLLSLAGSVYLGYNDAFNPGILLLLPVGMICGELLRRGSKTSSLFRSSGFGVLVELITRYVVSLILCGAGFALGLGILEIMKQQPGGF